MTIRNRVPIRLRDLTKSSLFVSNIETNFGLRKHFHFLDLVFSQTLHFIYDQNIEFPHRLVKFLYFLELR